MPLLKLKAKKVKTLAPSGLGDGEPSSSLSNPSSEPLSIPPTAPSSSTTSTSDATSNATFNATSNATLERAKELALGISSKASGPAQVIALGSTGSTLLSHHSQTSKLSDEDKYKNHLANCPEEATVDSDIYSTIKVDDFGAAMLRGMGWNPNKKEEKAVVVKARPQRLGLGAKQVAGAGGEKEERRKKYEDKRDITRTAPSVSLPPPPVVKKEEPKKKRKIDEIAYVPKKGDYITYNSTVCLVQNINTALGMCYVEVVASKEEKSVRIGSCKEYDKKKKVKKTWLIEGIIVKCVGDKKSKYYKCKGVVTSLNPSRIKIIDDKDYEGREIEVSDRDLETVVKTGKPCMILKGEEKGKKGKVVGKEGEWVRVEVDKRESRVELDYVANVL